MTFESDRRSTVSGMAHTDARIRGYRIAEIGRMTGFAPTALRFYEQAGVLPPPRRSSAGYRLYDDRAVERLRLIARAKGLGCTLEEITELVHAWDDEDCGPVKHRLQSFVTARIADVQRHITDQVAFAAQLRATSEQLATRPLDGPCDVTCGCTTEATAVPAAPEAEGDPPIACSLGADAVGTRVQEWQALFADVQRRRPLDGGIRLEFGRDAPVLEVARLAAAEYDCCPFFSFAITVDGRGIALEVSAPPDGLSLILSLLDATA